MSCATTNPVFSSASLAAEANHPADDSVVILTRRLRAGEEEAFREFHARYFDRLYHFLLALAGGREADAQDALQETLLRMSRYIRPFSDEEIFWSWLKMVARSAIRDRGRKHSRYFAALQRFALQRTPVPSPEDHERLHESLDEALKELDTSDRELIEAKYFEKTSTRQLSVQFGETERAVESRLLRLRRILRKRMMDHIERL